MKDTTAIDVETDQPQTMAVATTGAGAVGKAMEPADIPARAPVTAAQAKVEAIAALTMKAYERAASLVLSDEEIAKLAEEFPDEAFKSGAAGKENLIYIEHAFLRDRLNQVFKPGQWAIVPRNRWAEDFTTSNGKPASRVYVEAMLIIRGCFVSESVGEMEYFPHNASQNYGDAVEGAKTAALRRCCKELGIGLQAWKKDWCLGWWKRKNAGPGQNLKYEKTSTNDRRASEGVSTRTPPAQNAGKAAPANAPVANKPTPAPETEVKPWPQSGKTREWLINTKLARPDIGPGLVLEYFRKAGMLLPTEVVDDLPLRWLPADFRAYKLLEARILAFGAGSEAVKPYEPREVPAPSDIKAKLKPALDAAEAAAPGPTPRPVPPGVAAAQQKDPEWWRGVIVPIPHKGQSRADYVGDEDTIGSLYDQCKSGNQDACKRLYGFVGRYEPKPWVGRDKKEHPPSDIDVAFRAALDAFKDWHDRNGGDTDPNVRLPGDVRPEAEYEQPAPVDEEERNAIDNL